jgi:hypothetical protein
MFFKKNFQCFPAWYVYYFLVYMSVFVCMIEYEYMIEYVNIFY